MDPHFIRTTDIRSLTPLLQSVSHAAENLGLSRSQVNRRIATGALHPVEVGIERRKARLRVVQDGSEDILGPLLVSVSGAAKLLDVSHDFVSHLIRIKELAAIDIGNGRPKLRIRLSEIHRWIDSRDPLSSGASRGK